MNVTFDGFFIGFWCGVAFAFAFAWWVEYRERRKTETQQAVQRYKRGMDRYLKLQGFSEERIEEDDE